LDPQGQGTGWVFVGEFRARSAPVIARSELYPTACELIAISQAFNFFSTFKNSFAVRLREIKNIQEFSAGMNYPMRHMLQFAKPGFITRPG
jgi:hypothetical protein